MSTSLYLKLDRLAVRVSNLKSQANSTSHELGHLDILASDSKSNAEHLYSLSAEKNKLLSNSAGKFKSEIQAKGNSSPLELSSEQIWHDRKYFKDNMEVSEAQSSVIVNIDIGHIYTFIYVP